jgi:hypothetical protein
MHETGENDQRLLVKPFQRLLVKPLWSDTSFRKSATTIEHGKPATFEQILWLPVGIEHIVNLIVSCQSG